MPTYQITVTTVETVTSQTVLHVEAETEAEALEIAEEDSGDWRNGESSDRVKVWKGEAVIDADLGSTDYEAVVYDPDRQSTAGQGDVFEGA